MNLLFKKTNYIYFLLIIIICIGIFTFKDYGIGIEEHFQRKSGFYWLNYLLNITDFEILKNNADFRFDEIKKFTPNLFPIELVNYYGVLFDVPLAFFEAFLNISEPINYFYLRHIAIFTIFLLSSFYFYKIIEIRFKNINIAIFGFLIFVFTPRIYGNIFFDNKDIFFLSIFTINMYYYLKFNNDQKIKTLILFSLLCSFSTSARIIGILIPLSFYIILLFRCMSENNFKKYIRYSVLFSLFYVFFLFLHWPYLWTLNLHQWTNFFSPFFFAMNPTVFFNGEFYQSRYLPVYYVPLWIILSTPVYILFIFGLGILYQIRRFFLRFLKIEKKKNLFKFDLWRSKNENYDLFILMNFILILCLYISANLALLSGWRHFYFLNFFLIYYSCFCTYIILKFIRKKILLKKYFIFFLSIFFILQITDLYKYHPFQSVYFNNFISSKNKKKFEIDTQSLSRVHGLQTLLQSKKDKIYIATASWTPLEDARSLIPKKLWNRFVFLGTSNMNEADYIYSNYYYEVDTNYNKKYKIPKNFSLYKNLIIDGTRIYSIYKKN